MGGNIQSQPKLMTKLGDPEQKLIKNPFNSQKPGSFPGVHICSLMLHTVLVWVTACSVYYINTWDFISIWHTVEGLCTQQLSKTKLVKLSLEGKLVKSMLSFEPVWDNRKRKKPLPFEPWHVFMETEMDWAVAFDDFSAEVTLAAGTVTASEYRPL